MKFVEGIVKRIAKRFLVARRTELVESAVGVVDATMFEALLEVKKKIPELPESVLVAIREEADRYATEKAEKAIDDLIKKLSE